jgi:hypothetical protein
MMKHLREISAEVVQDLSAQERMVIVLLYAERLRVAEVCEVLEMPPEQVIAIATLVRCRVRMAVSGGLRSRAVPLWIESHVGDPFGLQSRRMSDRRQVIRFRQPPAMLPHRRSGPR